MRNPAYRIEGYQHVRAADGQPWVIVGACLCALAVGNAPLLVFTFGILANAITHEFGLSRASAFAALSAMTWAGALAIPWFGHCLDRYGVRTPTLVSIVLVCTGLAWVSQATSFPWFVAGFAFVGAFSGGLTPLPYATILTRRFDRRRGLALGIAMSGTGLGGALLPILTQQLQADYGWRYAYLGLATVAAAVGLVAVALFIREPRRHADSVSSPTQPQEPPAPPARAIGEWRSVLRERAFWLIAVPVFLVCTALTGTMVTLSPLMTDQGASAQGAALIVSVAGLSSALGRLATGALMDRWHAPWVAAGAFGASALGIALLGLGNNTMMHMLAGFLIGAGLGAEVDVVGYLISRYFQMSVYGLVYGLVFFAFGIATGTGGYFLALCHDLTGGYAIGIWLYAGICLMGAWMISRLGPYRSTQAPP